MLTCKPRVGIRVEDRRRREPTAAELRELVPGQATTALAAATQRAEPQVLDRVTELSQACVVAGDSVVLTPAAKHALQPRPDLRQVVVDTP